MEIEIEKMNLYQKMAAITAEMKVVPKGLSVDAGKGKSYKAVAERDVIDAVKPLEAKYRVYSYPAARELVEASVLESETSYGKKTSFFTRVKTTYVFVNIDNPAESISTEVFSEGIDPQDKGSGKAATYADKYCLMKAYKISTGEDLDEEASAPEEYRRVPRAPRDPGVPKQQPKMPLSKQNRAILNNCIVDTCAATGLSQKDVLAKMQELSGIAVKDVSDTNMGKIMDAIKTINGG